MAVEKNLVSMAEQFSGLPMKDLIGGPLQAAADANSMMAVTQTKFLLDSCFQREGTDPDFIYKPIMIKMELTRGVIKDSATKDGDITIENVTTTFNLPLLTIMPLNSLAVDNVDITFDMEVKSSYGEEMSQESTQQFSAESSFESKFSVGPFFSASVKGSVSYDSTDKTAEKSHYEKSNSAKYVVKVHAGQLPLPEGVTTIINAFAGAIQPIELPAPK